MAAVAAKFLPICHGSSSRWTTLVPGASAGQVREHYRLMIRLTHLLDRALAAEESVRAVRLRLTYDERVKTRLATTPNPIVIGSSLPTRPSTKTPMTLTVTESWILQMDQKQIRQCSDMQF